MIKGNLQKLNRKIAEACAKSRKSLCDIKLVCVTKKVDADKIVEVAKLSIADIGENRVQDAKAKFAFVKKTCEKLQLPKLNWHLIGHLQRNKVKDAVAIFNLIHSIDSLRLAEKIDAEAGLQNRQINILIQVNTSGEKTKFGLKPENLPELLSNISSLKNIQVLGLMTIAPFVKDSQEIRNCFKNLRILKDKTKEKFFGHNIDLKYLSMGMSNDFEIAIEEGADIIRIGTAIFKDE